jgi:peroxiredoxin Q/BCP
MSAWLIALVVIGVLVLAYLALNAGQGKPQHGDAAPDFTLPDQTGKTRTLGEFRGKWLVLYFYPRDDTPGCTEQAMRYRNAMRDLESLGAAVCGVSVNDSDSHAAFALKYKLPFPLLADVSGEVARRYGSLRSIGFFRAAKRNTFLIDPEGRIEKVYLGVNAARNTEDVTNDLRALTTSAQPADPARHGA